MKRFTPPNLNPMTELLAWMIILAFLLGLFGFLTHEPMAMGISGILLTASALVIGMGRTWKE